MKAVEARDDRLAAALSHLSALIPIFGAVAPLALWISQRERSPLLRFQALQALAYQILGALAYVVLTACQIAIPFPLIVASGAVASAGEQSGAIPPLVGFAFILILILVVITSGILCLGGPLYFLLALIAFWRVLNGYNFRYPILGKWVSRRLRPHPTEPIPG